MQPSPMADTSKPPPRTRLSMITVSSAMFVLGKRVHHQ
jgi:hypothetical protein